MTAQQREAVLEGAGRHISDSEKIGRRADGYFDAEYPPSVIGFLQAMMRETWKDENGSYSKWDRVARAGGVATIGRIILGR